MSNCFLVRDLRIRVLLRGAAGGRPSEIVNDPGGIVYDTSHRAGDEETDSKYAGGIRVKQYPSRRQYLGHAAHTSKSNVILTSTLSH